MSAKSAGKFADVVVPTGSEGMRMRMPEYITKSTPLVNLSIPESLREEIRRIDAADGTMTYCEKYAAFKSVSNTYFASNPTPPRQRACPELHLLAILFWEVTHRTKIGQTAGAKGEVIPYWGLCEFNYVLILGREESVADISWSLTDVHNEKLGTVVEAYKVVKEVVRARRLPVRPIYLEVLGLLKAFDTTEKEGLNRVWSPEIQNQIRAHYKMVPARPKGERKRRASAPTEREKGSKRVSKTLTIPEMAQTIPEIAQAKSDAERLKEARMGSSGEKRKRKPRTPKAESNGVHRIRLEGAEFVESAREQLDRYMEIHLEKIPLEDRPRVRASAISMLGNAFDTLNATCRRLAAQQVEHEGLEEATIAMTKRSEYEEACAYFNVRPPYGGLVDDVPIKKLYKLQSLDFHPDRNPDRLEEMSVRYMNLQKVWSIINDYHATHQAKKEG
jgi:hypothetical protein